MRLKDVANVTLGADDYESQVAFDGKQAVYIGIQVAPGANLLDVIAGVRKAFPEIQAQLPQGLRGGIVYDSTDFVNSSIREVVMTLVEALVIVTLVVFAFLGSLRSVLIPVVAIPLSLIGTFTIMLALGFSINLLTLLALVLAIGLVVDDAIIVVENVNRHLEEGMPPLAASIAAARELGGPIIAMTVVLIAVYVPIGFQGGLTGALFTEFAFTLAGAVTVSAIIALTLSPMMCSQLLKPHSQDERAGRTRLVRLHRPRVRARCAAATSAGCMAALTICRSPRCSRLLVLGSIYFLYAGAQERTRAAGRPGHHHRLVDAGAERDLAAEAALFARRSTTIFAKHPETAHVFQIDAPGQSIAGMVFKPWDQRKRDHQRSCSRCCSRSLDEHRRRARRGVPAAAAAGQPGPAAAVRHRRPPIRSTRLNDVAQHFLQEAVQERHVHLPRHRSQDRPAAVDRRDRPRQDRAARPEDERRRRGARQRCWAAATSTISASTAAPTRSSRRCSSASG